MDKPNECDLADGASDGGPFPIRAIRHIRFRHGFFCPRCGHRHVQRWGTFATRGGVRQRYRCLHCRRTFSDLTGTPLAYLKRLDSWRRFCRVALGAFTVRAAASFLGIDPTTSFRWRHRLLAQLRVRERVSLRQRVSVDFAWLPFSEKGSRRLRRPPRRVRFEGFSSETRAVWLVVACDPWRRSFATTVGTERPRHDVIRGALAGRLGEEVTLVCRRNRLIPLTPVAKALGAKLDLERPPSDPAAWPRTWDHGSVRPKLCPGATDLYPEPGRLCVVRIRRWMKRFCGVATKYLDSYLVWFRMLELTDVPASGPEVC